MTNLKKENIQEEPYKVKFSKSYSFEGKDYTEIDLSDIKNLTGKDLTAAEQIFASSGNMAPITEMSIGYACIIAHKATNKPKEFFENLPANEAIKVKNVVMGFFYS